MKAITNMGLTGALLTNCKGLQSELTSSSIMKGREREQK